MDSSLVSIIIPIYNTAEYVEKCILSVLSQSYKNIELILVNDGSTDNSGKICKKYENLPNVIYIEQENRGVTAARKQGVDTAKGEWIMFVDSDDLLVEDSIYGLMDICESADIIIGANQRNIDSVKKLPDIISKEKYLEMQYAREISASPWAKLYRRRLFDEQALTFPKHIVRCEDYLMNLVLAINNQSDVYVYKHQICFIRNNPTSATHTRLLTLDYMLELCKRADDIISNHIPYGIFLNQRVKQRIYFFYEAMHDTKYTSNSHHPFIKDIKRCMNEAGVWSPIDRWLLSISSPWAVETVWNLRRVIMRIKNPFMIKRDIKKILTYIHSSDITDK